MCAVIARECDAMGTKDTWKRFELRAAACDRIRQPTTGDRLGVSALSGHVVAWGIFLKIASALSCGISHSHPDGWRIEWVIEWRLVFHPVPFDIGRRADRTDSKITFCNFGMILNYWCFGLGIFGKYLGTILGYLSTILVEYTTVCSCLPL